MKKIIKVLLIEDHLIARIGISAIINQQPDMAVAAEAATGEQGIKLFQEHQPDVTIMDLRLPDISGTDAIEIICRENPDARIIALTSLIGDAEIKRALKAGAMGYIFKDVLGEELATAIRSVNLGKKYISPAAAAIISEHITDDDLTAGEQRVLEMIIGGNSNKQIALGLNISESTVKTYVGNLLSKLGVADRTAAAISAVKRGLVRLTKN